MLYLLVVIKHATSLVLLFSQKHAAMKKQLLLAATLLLPAISSMGAGFQLNLQGLRQLAMGGGGAAWPWDAATVFYNPGGLTRLQGIQAYGGALLIIPKVRYVQSPTGGYSYNSVNQVFTPFNLYVGGPVRPGSRLAVGIGVYTPFGSGLKWDDDWTGEVHATLQLPDRIYKFKAPRPKGGVVSPRLDWVEREVAGEQPNGQRLNPLKVVSVVEVPNNPRLLTGGVSEIFDVTDIQDRINKTLFDRMQTQEFGVDPQKWAKAFPDEDDDGNPNVVEFGRNRMITTNIAETAFGNFAVAPLDPYSNAKREDVKDIASRTRTPAQYLLGELNNVNGSTLQASESGLVSKVKQRLRPFSEAAEETMRVARRAANLPESAGAQLETIWRDPQYRTEGELTDAVVKRLQSRISSLRQAREDVGYSATQIERLEADDQREAFDPIAQQILRDVNVGGADADDRA